MLGEKGEGRGERGEGRGERGEGERGREGERERGREGERERGREGREEGKAEVGCTLDVEALVVVGGARRGRSSEEELDGSLA